MGLRHHAATRGDSRQRNNPAASWDGYQRPSTGRRFARGLCRGDQRPLITENHIGAVVGEANKRGAQRIEPTAEAEQGWVATIFQTAPKTFNFQAECTPGYYNGEGNPRPVSFSFGPGPVVFHELLRQWRAEGGMDQVIS